MFPVEAHKPICRARRTLLQGDLHQVGNVRVLHAASESIHLRHRDAEPLPAVPRDDGMPSEAEKRGNRESNYSTTVKQLVSTRIEQHLEVRKFVKHLMII